MKDDYQKALKKLLFFLLNPVHFNWQSYQKQKESGTSGQRSSGYETSSKIFIHYVLSGQVWWCNVKQFLKYFKICICKFMQVNSWHHKLFHFICPFEYETCGKEGKKLQKIWISWEWKELFRGDKKHFS